MSINFKKGFNSRNNSKLEKISNISKKDLLDILSYTGVLERLGNSEKRGNISKFKKNNNCLTESEFKKINNIVGEYVEQYGQDIDSLIYDNYGINFDEKIDLLFKQISKVLSERNSDISDYLLNNGINFHKNLDFTGGLKFDIGNFENLENEDLKKFLFNPNFTRLEGEKLYSRGYGYFFNLNGLYKDENGFMKLESNIFFDTVFYYYRDINNLLQSFNNKKISNISEEEKKSLLILLEHYKNISFFLINIFTNIQNPEFFKNSTKMKGQQFQKYYEKNDNNPFNNKDFFEKIPSIISYLESEAEKTVDLFNDINLGFDNKINFEQENIGKDMFDNIGDFFDYLNKVAEESNNEGEVKNIKKLQNKISMSFIRIIREQDNPAKMLLAATNLLSKMDSKDFEKDLVLLGVLYGGIEYPFFVKYMIKRLGLSEKSLDIYLTTVSNYNMRNKKEIASIGNYPCSKEIDGGGKNFLVLDDNIYNGGTLQSLINQLGQNNNIIDASAVEVGLRRTNFSKLKEGSNMSFLLSKVKMSASTTPISKKINKYNNLILKYISNRLPNIVGKP
ncbi:phosphoribosyltransferase [Candidatus Vampirococcus lugosii]|uniref:Phosphoribosyltransferase domain-containing protein n=2 Tax=Candidatus Vampirococcus lugosii TaxID=2789015 RepID=A0ABS5QJT0_9BACT|nr:phosphoribosyltransferase [Candidatus Vampirococcus lugosii]MBS8121525.1 hypothetical protein [Candidatus Vampirococcus lugosii]